MVLNVARLKSGFLRSTIIFHQGVKKVVAHLAEGPNNYIFYFSPDGRRFNTLEEIKLHVSQIEVVNIGKRKRTNNGEGKQPKRPRQSDEVETPTGSDAECGPNNCQIMSTEEVVRRRKQISNSKKGSGDSLLKKMLIKEARMKIWREQQQLLWSQQHQQLWSQQFLYTTTV